MKTAWNTIAVAALAIGCGGSPAKPADTANQTKASTADDTYGPLEYGADYASWQKMNTESFPSKTHGGRFVDVYVNDVGADAYRSDDAAFPEGTIIVKTSWESKDGQPTDVAGPIFVMKKLAAGADPSTNDWWYALHWETVPESWQSKMGGATQVYWHSPSKKVGYCHGCHENYDREVGRVPADKRASATPSATSEN
jgi:hypothetical protein